MGIVKLFQLTGIVVVCLAFHVEGGVRRHYSNNLQSPLSVFNFGDLSEPENEEEPTPHPSSPSTTIQQLEETYRCNEMNSSHNRVLNLIARSQPANVTSFQNAQEDIPMRTVKYVAKKNPAHIQRRGENSFYFEVKREKNVAVTMINLWVYIRPVNTKTNAPVTLGISSSNATSAGESDRSQFTNFVAHVVDLSKSTNIGFWERISLSHIANELLISSQQKISVVIWSQEFPDLIATGEASKEEKFKPHLKISNFISSTRSTKNRCKLHHYTLDFGEIGWDWIIYPKSYNAKYCAGQCFPALSGDGTSSGVAGQVNEQGPCCRPSGYAPLSLLYYDQEGNVVYSEMPDMVVTGCECAY